MLNTIVPIFSAGVAAGGDYESIATVTVGSGGAAEINFTSIPADYTHLQLRALFKTSSSLGTVRYRVGNGSIDTGTNYSYHELAGDGSSASVNNNAPNSDTGYVLFSSERQYNFVMISDLLDYKNSNKFKTIRTLAGGDNNGEGTVGLSSFAWRSTSAITHIRFYLQFGNFSQYSHFALYGIKSA